MRKIAPILALPLLLVGCADSESVHVDSVGEVQDLIAHSSTPCEDWQEFDDDSALCSINGVRNTVAIKDGPRTFVEKSFIDDEDTVAGIVGDNWALVCDLGIRFGECEKLADEIGGEYVTRDTI